MKNKKLSKVWLKRNLTSELWEEILSRLPVKSLLRFRCVSKSWHSLIAGDDFCQLHLKNFKNNRDETHLLVVEGKQQKCVVRCSDNFERNPEKILSLGRRYREGKYQIECSIDGLYLLKTSTREDDLGFNDLLVFNPSIKKLLTIPSLPDIERPPDSYFFDAEIGLGYDPLLKDYKHVRLTFKHGGDFKCNHVLQSVAIYTIGASSWKIKQFEGKGICSSWSWIIDYNNIKAVYFRGSLYFIADYLDKGVQLRSICSSDSELVSFDLSSEVFSSTSFPDDPRLQDIGTRTLALADGGSSLALFEFEYEITMWVLGDSGGKTEDMCWNKRYSVDLMIPDSSKFLYLKKNGDLLMRWCNVRSCIGLLTQDLAQQWSLVTSYNPERVEEKILLQRKCRNFKIHDVFGYVESLAMLK